MQCPHRSSKPQVGSGYVSLAKDLLRFKVLGQKTIKLDLDRLKDGKSTEATLRNNKAQWYKICWLPYNQTVLR